MLEKLNKISEDLKLWEKAKSNALNCIETYISENIIYDDFPNLINVQKNDFDFNKKSQSLIFWLDGNETYIIRTTYDLQLKIENKCLSGYYSFDINENGNFIDEWFIMNKNNGS